MTTNRNKRDDRERTIKLILTLNREKYTGGENWLGHGSRGGKAACVDDMLLDGATKSELLKQRGGIYEHFSHLENEHGLPIEKVGGNYRFNRKELQIREEDRELLNEIDLQETHKQPGFPNHKPATHRKYDKDKALPLSLPILTTSSFTSMNESFIEMLQKRLASTSIGPSTARGMGPEGTISAARDFLKQIDLSIFENVNSQIEFLSVLNKITIDLKAALPKGAQHWGSARKFLNIFLRGAHYNRFLCERYDLFRFEAWLEVPLDSHVAKGLHTEEGAKVLPRWRTVIGLSPNESAIFQDFAERVAQSKGTHRVHLDLLYWRGTHMTEKIQSR